MNELSISTPKPVIGLPGTLSDDALDRAIAGRCDTDRAQQQVRDLMRVYWQPNEPAEDRVRYETLIVKDLAQFSDWAVASALKEWRRTMAKRPTPADLIALCSRYRQNAVVQRNARLGPIQPGPTATHAGHSSTISEACRASFKRIAAEAGFVEHQGEWITQAHRDDLDTVETQRPPHWTEREETAGRWADALRRARAGNRLMSCKEDLR